MEYFKLLIKTQPYFIKRTRKTIGTVTYNYTVRSQLL